MSTKRPDQLSGVTSLGAGDILIAEINPDNAGSRKVVKITKDNLLSGVSGASVSGVTGVWNVGVGSGIVSGVVDSDAYFKSLIGGTNLQVVGNDSSLTFNVTGISGGSSSTSFTGNLLSMSGCTLYASGGQVGINTCEPAAGYSLHVSGASLFSGNQADTSTLVVEGTFPGTGAVIGGGHIAGTALYITEGISYFDGYTYFGKDPVGNAPNPWGALFGEGDGQTVISSGILLGSFSTTERDKIGATHGSIVYNSTLDEFNFFQNGDWVTFTTGVGDIGVTGASNIGAGSGLISGVTGDSIQVKSLVAGTNITIDGDSSSLTINSAGGGGGGGTTSAFAFFSNALNNAGIIEKTYYQTPTADTYLSGIDVDSASDLTLYLRWDGPHDAYMGTGYINGQAIPTGNITQLGTSTRRFQGYISGLNLAGTTIITGVANGFTGTISLAEAGAGPSPTSLHIAPITGATPKAGENLGTTHLKGGDQINVYATFTTSDVTGIKVFDSGISDGIAYTSYSLTDTGDGNHTATIPVTVTADRSNAQGVSIVAQNTFGTAGNETSSSNTINLDQVYPSISASDPTSYDGRSDGLRSGEDTTFANTISNWTDGVDYILYSGIESPDYEISITNSGTWENPKTVSYVSGIYNNSDNLRINVSRTGNGATDSDDVKIKIANGPVITGIDLSSTAASATSPDVVGTSQIKGGDTVNADVYLSGNGVLISQIKLSVSNAGVSDGTQTAYTYYGTNSTEADGSFKYTVPVKVTSSVGRDGNQDVTVTAQNQYTSMGRSDSFTSAASAEVHNSTVPTVTISSIAYPAGQSGLKDTESATVTNSTGNADTVVYGSPNGDLTVSNTTTFEASKTVTRNNGNYNISTNNFTLSGTRAANGMVRGTSTVVNIAHTAAAFTINNLASYIPVNTGQAVTDNFDLDIDQVLYEIPSLSLDASQSPQSTLTTGASGTGVNANDYQISVLATDEKGEFTFGVSGRNLAGKLTTTIGTNPNYTLSGIVFGSGYISELSPCQGLFYLGGPVIGPSTIYMENVSEAAGGPYGGTVYNYQAFSDGFSFDQWCTGNYDNKFAIVTSGAVAPYFTASATGDYLFNLDQTNRQANTSFPGALIVISQPEP